MRLERRIASYLAMVWLVAVAGCASEGPPEEEAAAPPVAPAEPDTVVEPPAPQITISPVSNIDPGRFPHPSHADVACVTCHAGVPGHSMHSRVACSECHAAPPGGNARPTTAECNACHHGPSQTRACSACHGDRTPPPRDIVFSASFSVRPAPTRMTLPFDHARHAGNACSTCHVAGGGIVPAPDCGSCHESHHDEARRCLTCHTGQTLNMHGRDAHLGCGGAGCHQDPTVNALEETRSVCLVCHAQQENHEAGTECSLCHLVGDRPAAEPSAFAHVRGTG